MIRDKGGIGYDGEVWAEHRQYEENPLSTFTLVHLPEAFDLIAGDLFPETWDCDEIHNVERIIPSLPSTERAFAPDGSLTDYGRPRQEEARQLYLETIEDAREAVEDEHGYDLEVPAYHGQIVRGGDMNRTAWAIACQYQGELERKKQVAAPGRLHMVAETICNLAEHGVLETVARPMRGGAAVSLPRDVWAVDDVIGRVAAATIDLAQPFNPKAPATHRMFVVRSSLDAWRKAHRAKKMRLEEEDNREPEQEAKATGNPGQPPKKHGGAIAAFCLWALNGNLETAIGEKDEVIGLRLIEEYKKRGIKPPHVKNAGRDARAALNELAGPGGAERSH